MNLTVVPDINGKINGSIKTSSGITDVSGRFTTTFYLNANVTGDGSVKVNASFVNLSNDVVIRYTNNSYLNITTAINKSYAAVNGTIGVTITVDGIGYQAGRPPADVIFVMDRSGSMGDAQGFTNYGANVGGWLGATVLDETSQATKNAVTNFTYNHMLNTRMILKAWQSTPTYSFNAKYLSASYVLSTGGSGTGFPTTMDSGSTATITVTMQNNGNTPWSESALPGYPVPTQVEGVRLTYYSDPGVFGNDWSCHYWRKSSDHWRYRCV